jgi:hypothetical protein
MSDSSNIQQIVETVVSEVFQSRMAELRTEVAQRVVEQLGWFAGGDGAGNSSALLNSAVLAVQNSTSQAEILNTLLESASGFCGRVALFVLRGSSAVGWKARGFAENDFVKHLSCDPSSGLAGRAVKDRMPVSAAATEFSPELVKAAGNPVDGNALVLPLLVREKVPALMYADRGSGPAGQLDSSALELLVRCTGLWLETVAARRAGGGAAIPDAPIVPAERVVEKPLAVAHVPEPPVMPAERVSESAASLTGTTTAAPEPAAAAKPMAPSITPAIAPAASDDEVHKRAKRFAKLLVDEIRLYNQSKVAEGRKKRDLYDRLKEDIDKSRATYEKRYGSTAAASANYFDQELVRILADNDAALLGSNFPGQ